MSESEYRLGMVLRDRKVLIVSDDLKYRDHVLYKPTNKVCINGDEVKLLAIIHGDEASRKLVCDKIRSSEDIDFTSESLLACMRLYGVELRLFTHSDVHVLQFIRGVETHSVLKDCTRTSFWYGATKDRELLLKYGLIGAPKLRSAMRDEALAKSFPLVWVVEL